MKIYLDNCCFNRPFDDQSDLKIYLESEAIRAILGLCEKKQHNLVISEISKFEIENTPNQTLREQLNLIVSVADFVIEMNPQIILRAKQFENLGIKAFDAMHLAFAEFNAEIFLTVDDKFLKKALAIKDLAVPVNNPLKWLYEVLQ